MIPVSLTKLDQAVQSVFRISADDVDPEICISSLYHSENGMLDYSDTYQKTCWKKDKFKTQLEGTLTLDLIEHIRWDEDSTKIKTPEQFIQKSELFLKEHSECQLGVKTFPTANKLYPGVQIPIECSVSTQWKFDPTETAFTNSLQKAQSQLEKQLESLSMRFNIK